MYIIYFSNYLAQHEHKVRTYAEQAAILQAGLKHHLRGLWKLLGLFGIVESRERDQRLVFNQIAHLNAQEARHWAKGRSGEDVLAASLASLDGRFCLLRNYTPPPAPNYGAILTPS